MAPPFVRARSPFPSRPPDDGVGATLDPGLQATWDSLVTAFSDQTETAITREIIVRAKRGRKALPDLIRSATDAQIDVASVAVKEPDLEDVFLHLTGRALRD